MGLRSKFKELSFKDKVDMIEDILTIILSVGALWGSVLAWQNGFWHNLKHVVEHYHNEIIQEEQNLLHF